MSDLNITINTVKNQSSPDFSSWFATKYGFGSGPFALVFPDAHTKADLLQAYIDALTPRGPDDAGASPRSEA